MGKFIVFEGTDGSGKRTQLKLLGDYLKKQNIQFSTLDFPRYSESVFGDLAGKMLKGELGPVENIPAHLAILPYACDRWLAKEDLKNWLQEGRIVLSNRFTASSAVYQAAKLKDEKQDEFMKWVIKLEQEIIGLPSPDMTIFFHVPVAVAQKLMEERGVMKDMYERNIAMLSKVEELYGRLGNKTKNWKIIECTKDGSMRTKEEIHKEVLVIIGL